MNKDHTYIIEIHGFRYKFRVNDDGNREVFFRYEWFNINDFIDRLMEAGHYGQVAYLAVYGLQKINGDRTNK